MRVPCFMASVDCGWRGIRARHHGSWIMDHGSWLMHDGRQCNCLSRKLLSFAGQAMEGREGKGQARMDGCGVADESKGVGGEGTGK